MIQLTGSQGAMLGVEKARLGRCLEHAQAGSLPHARYVPSHNLSSRVDARWRRQKLSHRRVIVYGAVEALSYLARQP